MTPRNKDITQEPWREAFNEKFLAYSGGAPFYTAYVDNFRDWFSWGWTARDRTAGARIAELERQVENLQLRLGSGGRP